ncbi:dihydrofolate reductase family protein [Chryseolinea sp. H1M3-3]|uniref:dihydrofolate reductase family protein n=1 Tax=Chryseolinea sp. H1M3-3 TaxID=3034144 RepID=UPI0023EABD43|nr:dihydrofolate reductase family protein [Chryseolinea sp. H1M3-3]
MRKLKLQVVITIDGFIAGPNGEMDWMVGDWDDKLKDYIREITEPVDCIVLGRKLAQEFIPHWTAAFNNPAGAEEGSKKMVETPKIVFSKTQTKSEWENTVIENGDLVEEITKLKKQNGGDIIVYGGASFVSALIKHGLIDELHLLINPTAIGNGMPIFRELDNTQSFNLIHAIPFECGIVVLYYKPKRS